jgi:beta-lactam-binding protein with PASTA domain
VMSGMPIEAFPAPPADFGVKPKRQPRPRIRVPDVVDLSVKDATSALEEAGFRVATQDVDSGRRAGTVVAQSPGAGERAPDGSTVSLDVSNGRRPGTTVPNVVGDDAVAARSVLRDAGFAVAVELQKVGQDDKVRVVLSQSPAGGSTARRGETVTITVGKKQSSGGSG